MKRKKKEDLDDVDRDQIRERIKREQAVVDDLKSRGLPIAAEHHGRIIPALETWL